MRPQDAGRPIRQLSLVQPYQSITVALILPSRLRYK
jgi:hypothetical protein